MLVYVGTYTEADSQGIELYRLDQKFGTLRYLRTIPKVKNPSYLCLSPDQRYLYAANELLESDGRPTGRISAFALESNGGTPVLINRVGSHGRAPCYMTVSANGKYVLANNYLDGTAVSLPVLENGGLGQPVSIIKQKGSGPVKGRQDASHVHSINLDPQNNFAVIADLGSDQLSVFAFNSRTGQLTPQEDKTVQTAPGAGPRHLTFSPDGKRLYVANELNSTVEAYSFNTATGELKRLQTVSTLPGEFKGTNYPADIHISPDGKFLYISNRGHESIAIFSVNSQNGELSLLTTEPVNGSWPRNFVITPEGKYLLVANQKSRNLVLFRRDASTGRLKRLSSVPTVAAPACVKIGPFE